MWSTYLPNYQMFELWSHKHHLPIWFIPSSLWIDFLRAIYRICVEKNCTNVWLHNQNYKIFPSSKEGVQRTLQWRTWLVQFFPTQTHRPNSPTPLTDDSSENFHDVFYFIFSYNLAKNEEKHVMEIYGWGVRNFPVVRKWSRWIRPMTPKCFVLICELPQEL